MPEPEKTLEELDLLAPELGHLRAALRAAQHGDEGDDEDLDQVVPDILGARIGNTLERGDEELHGGTPRWGAPSSIHDSQLGKQERVRSYAIPLR